MNYAVILQRMIPPVLAGVCFSKNPVDDKHETVVEAVEGHGEELMQRGATPLRWKIKKTKIREGDENYKHIRIIFELAESTAKLQARYGKHIDLEWVYDGQDVYYVQLRSITGEKKISIYSNKMAKEMLPGQIKPLVWSVNIPLVIGTKIDLLTSITGPLDIRPQDLAKSFYNRTYFNVGALGEIFSEFGVPMESIEYMMLNESATRHSFKPGLRTLKHTGRLLRFIRSILRLETFFLKEYQELLPRYKELAQKLSGNLSPEDFFQHFEELYQEGKRLTHLNVLIPLLMRVHNNRFAKKLKRIGVKYDQLSFAEDFPEAADFDPLPGIRHIQKSLQALPPSIREKCTSHRALMGEEGTGAVRDELNKFMERFGHLSESGNDFSYPKWQEDPEFVFQMILDHEEREREHEAVHFKDIPYSKLLHPRLRSAYQKAGRFKVYREQISSLYIFGYGLFRTLYLTLAEAFIKAGLIEKSEDIFYLTKAEVDALVLKKDITPEDECMTRVRERKAEMESSSDLILPSVIYGEVAPILDRKDLVNFRGTATSPGNYKGKARIVRETSDFNKVENGDVVIIPFSDVSWTPVLCKAGAIVAESGGMLSHCSIIAREMGIPSLVSVDNACALKDGILITVDGSNGLLTVHERK